MNEIRFVENGEELLEYLRRQGKYAAPGEAPRPGLILLDLNMPRKDGRAVLKEIKSDPDLRTIPVVVLTTSKADEDLSQLRSRREQLHREARHLRGAGGYFADAGEILVRDRRPSAGEEVAAAEGRGQRSGQHDNGRGQAVQGACRPLNLSTAFSDFRLLRLPTSDFRPPTSDPVLSSTELAALRQDYSQRGLRRGELDRDPIAQFNRWLAEAAEQQLLEPNAMTLATVDADGQPWSRTVLLKICDARGFTFFTNYEGAKGRQLAANPRAALTFWWGGAGAAGQCHRHDQHDLARGEPTLLSFAAREQPTRRVGVAAERSRRQPRRTRTAVHRRA